MPHSVAERAADCPQFTLRSLLSCVTALAAGIASCAQLGGYSVTILPLCVTLLVAFAGGGSWKEGLWLSLYVYGIAMLVGAMLLAMTALAVTVGVWMG